MYLWSFHDYSTIHSCARLLVVARDLSMLECVYRLVWSYWRILRTMASPDFSSTCSCMHKDCIYARYECIWSVYLGTEAREEVKITPEVQWLGGLRGALECRD